MLFQLRCAWFLFFAVFLVSIFFLQSMILRIQVQLAWFARTTVHPTKTHYIWCCGWAQATTGSVKG